MHYLIALVLGYLLGVFTPGIIRKLRGEAKQGVQLAEVDIQKLDQDLKKL